MKKILFALAAIALAGATQAASFTWKTYTGQYVYQAGSSTKLSGYFLRMNRKAIVFPTCRNTMARNFYLT